MIGAIAHRGGDALLPQVAARVRAAIAAASDSGAFRDLLIHLMARPGRVLAPGGSPKWPAFVLDTCQALGGHLDGAVEAAAAVEFAVAAIDVADDLIDDEWDVAGAPRERALNASLALSWLALRCVRQLAEPLGIERARRIGDLLVQGSLASCAGQDLDLQLEATTEVGEELAHDMTRRKSGSLVAMACQIGAAVATDDPGILNQVGTFGTHVGLVAQLLNDLVGVEYDSRERGSDLRRKKKTLPIAYALHCAHDEGISEILAWYQAAPPLSNRDEEHLAMTLRDLGALHYTWVVADTHRRQALAIVRELAQATGREEVYGLQRLVPTVRSRRTRRR